MRIHVRYAKQTDVKGMLPLKRALNLAMEKEEVHNRSPPVGIHIATALTSPLSKTQAIIHSFVYPSLA